MATDQMAQRSEERMRDRLRHTRAYCLRKNGSFVDGETAEAGWMVARATRHNTPRRFGFASQRRNARFESLARDTHNSLRIAVTLLGPIIALLTVACSTNPPPAPIPPSPSRTVAIGLNAGFHGPLPPETVSRLCGPLTVRTPQLSGDALDQYLASIASCPQFKTLALVEGPDQPLAVAFASRPVQMIELMNEAELAPNNFTPTQYAQFIGAAAQAIRAVNPTVTIITGGVYTLDADTKQRILGALAVCPGCWVGVHLYEPLAQTDLDWLAALPTQIAVTETGFPTRCDPARLSQQQVFLQGMINQLSTVPNVALIVIYQWPDGTGCTDLDTFGIVGKPAESLLK
jgi:hypothetical protein